VSQTVFDAGGLYHKETAAKQALLQARWQYRSAVQTAVQNVADTLYAIKSDADALAAVSDAEQAAKVSRDVTQRQFDEGMVGYLVLLNADTAYQQAKIARVQAETNRYGDAATLFQALGGGWWNRTKAE
jgi:outer membrane protein TolC